MDARGYARLATAASDAELQQHRVGGSAWIGRRRYPALFLCAGLALACLACLLLLGSLSVLPGLHSLSTPSSWCAASDPSASALAAAASLEPPLPSFSSVTRVCMLVRTRSRTFRHIPTFMSLLRHNAHPPNLFFVVTDGNSSHAEMERWVERGNRAAGQRIGRTLRIAREEVRVAYPALDSAHDAAFAYTDVAMSLLTEQPQYRGQCDWAMITNVDNVYSGHFLDRVEQEMAKGYQLIGMNTISRPPVKGLERDTRQDSSDDETSRVLDIDWKEGLVPLGAAVWNASLWQQLRSSDGSASATSRTRLSEGLFFHKAVELNVPRIAVRQIMLVQQADYAYNDTAI